MTLHCKDLRHDLVAFVDGELPSERVAEVEAHVLACAPCAAEVEAHRAVWDALGVIDEDAPLGVSEAAWLDTMEAGIRRRGRPVVLWRWVAAAAVLALAVGLGIGSAITPAAPGAVAVQPSGPAPQRPDGPSPAPSLPVTSPAPSRPVASPAPTRSVITRPSQRPTTPSDPYAGLSPEEIAVVENLDVLVYLQTEEDVELLQNLELLEDLDELELEGSG